MSKLTAAQKLALERYRDSARRKAEYLVDQNYRLYEVDYLKITLESDDETVYIYPSGTVVTKDH